MQNDWRYSGGRTVIRTRCPWRKLTIDPRRASRSNRVKEKTPLNEKNLEEPDSAGEQILFLQVGQDTVREVDGVREMRRRLED